MDLLPYCTHVTTEGGERNVNNLFQMVLLMGEMCKNEAVGRVLLAYELYI